jgi:hypothetical protein
MNSYFNFLDTVALNKKINSGEFPFSQNLFWDATLETIDLQKHKNFVIERVLMRGFLADFYILQKIYSPKEIEVLLKKSKVLDAKTRNFCSHYFNIPVTETYAPSYYS